ncbi:hypothetical protein DFJ73DRAFT_810153 [Zopfochytrium polystomum]|nr:hypothetical protein DFJ73DRAFT_810153 [Zopfochytrium polystomum]
MVSAPSSAWLLGRNTSLFSASHLAHRGSRSAPKSQLPSPTCAAGLSPPISSAARSCAVSLSVTFDSIPSLARGRICSPAMPIRTCAAILLLLVRSSVAQTMPSSTASPNAADSNGVGGDTMSIASGVGGIVVGLLVAASLGSIALFFLKTYLKKLRAGEPQKQGVTPSTFAVDVGYAEYPSKPFDFVGAQLPLVNGPASPQTPFLGSNTQGFGPSVPPPTGQSAFSSESTVPYGQQLNSNPRRSRIRDFANMPLRPILTMSNARRGPLTPASSRSSRASAGLSSRQSTPVGRGSTAGGSMLRSYFSPLARGTLDRTDGRAEVGTSNGGASGSATSISIEHLQDRLVPPFAPESSNLTGRITSRTPTPTKLRDQTFLSRDSFDPDPPQNPFESTDQPPSSVPTSTTEAPLDMLPRDFQKATSDLVSNFKPIDQRMLSMVSTTTDSSAPDVSTLSVITQSTNTTNSSPPRLLQPPGAPLNPRLQQLQSGASESDGPRDSVVSYQSEENFFSFLQQRATTTPSNVPSSAVASPTSERPRVVFNSPIPITPQTQPPPSPDSLDSPFSDLARERLASQVQPTVGLLGPGGVRYDVSMVSLKEQRSASGRVIDRRVSADAETEDDEADETRSSLSAATDLFEDGSEYGRP